MSRQQDERPAPGSARRDAVLESALGTFARFGYRKTSMEEVARAARISRPGLYFLFDSKEALFRAAATQMLERDIAAVERVLADPDRPLGERLLEAFDQWAGRYVGPLARDITEVIEANPDLLGPIAQTLSQRFGQLLTDAIAAVCGPDSAARAAPTLISTSIGLKRQVASQELYRERLATAIDLYLTGCR
ncbi:TetR/AcrR family transcriptional regulator [Kineosporia mesophila]|nr:TetR/AcrR family transcriptional regulator [Kineosporia mesophila]MCD5351020.1 TetR/AcrR family transcriptional regulator [Kineosporia mesophila]